MRNHVIAVATVLALVAGAPPALASGTDVIRDCTDDEVMAKTYTQQEYRDALAKLPADADQYGDCRDIIARAQESSATKGASKTPAKKGHGAATPGAGTPGPGASAPASSKPAKDQLAAATPADRAAARDATRNGSTATAAPGNPVAGTEGAGRAPGASQASDLPAPVLVLLALLLAGTLALAAVRIRSLVHVRRA
jgi:cobalamin biosynthesis Mg chelatase CobN